MPGWTGRTREILHQEGLRGLGSHGIQALGIYRHVLVQGGPFTTPPDRSDLALSCERLEITDLDEYLELRPDQDRAEITARFESGILCFGARHQGRLIASLWCAIDRMVVDYLDCEILLAPDTAYPHDAYVLPEFRGHRVTGHLGGFRREALRQMGRVRGLALIWSVNRTAIRRGLLRGNRWVGRLLRYQIGPVRYFVLEESEVEGGPLFRLAHDHWVSVRPLPSGWEVQEQARLKARTGL